MISTGRASELAARSAHRRIVMTVTTTYKARREERFATPDVADRHDHPAPARARSLMISPTYRLASANTLAPRPRFRHAGGDGARVLAQIHELTSARRAEVADHPKPMPNAERLEARLWYHAELQSLVRAAGAGLGPARRPDHYARWWAWLPDRSRHLHQAAGGGLFGADLRLWINVQVAGVVWREPHGFGSTTGGGCLSGVPGSSARHWLISRKNRLHDARGCPPRGLTAAARRCYFWSVAERTRWIDDPPVLPVLPIGLIGWLLAAPVLITTSCDHEHRWLVSNCGWRRRDRDAGAVLMCVIFAGLYRRAELLLDSSFSTQRRIAGESLPSSCRAGFVGHGATAHCRRAMKWPSGCAERDVPRMAAWPTRLYAAAPYRLSQSYAATLAFAGDRPMSKARTPPKATQPVDRVCCMPVRGCCGQLACPVFRDGQRIWRRASPHSGSLLQADRGAKR